MLSYIKLKKFNDVIDVIIDNNLQNLTFVNNNNDIMDNKFYECFNINYDTNFKNNIHIMINYIFGYSYKNIENTKENIEKAILYFESCLISAKENILLNLIKNIHTNLIQLYFTDKNKYFIKLKNIYEIECLHSQYIDLLIDNNLKNDANDYIKNLFRDEFALLDDDINIDYYLDKYIIFNDNDVLFLLDKYTTFKKINKIKMLLENIDNHIISKEVIIEVLYEYMKLNNDDKLKYCEIIFDEIEKIDNKNIKINDIITNTINIYNNDLYWNNKLGTLKYKKYINKKNLDIINNNYCKFLTLYKYFDINQIKIDQCTICYDKRNIIQLNCHESHIVCYKCYARIDKCPLCRDHIHS
jgi:hypothetical protein